MRLPQHKSSKAYLLSKKADNHFDIFTTNVQAAGSTWQAEKLLNDKKRREQLTRIFDGFEPLIYQLLLNLHEKFELTRIAHKPILP